MDMKKPEKLENVDTKKLSEICQQYIDFVDNNKEYHEDNDFEHYIFESAMETIFGAKVWSFIRNRQ
jgi:hypothetical protein